MIALLAALLLSADPAAGIKVTIVQGTLEVKAGAAEAFAPAKAGDQIEFPVTIKTGAGTKALIELPDGCELRVNEQTELVVETHKKMVIKHGRIFLKVTPSAAPVDFATDLHPMKLEACSARSEWTHAPTSTR
jgi:ferric-dicitrate binding protein FerR (iron transport regulator)